MKKEVHIISYFSFPTDLANELAGWEEFKSGEQYCVDLECSETKETVHVRLVEKDDDASYVAVTSNCGGRLFERALGAVTFALAQHSDNLMVSKCT